jgi:hypothetical protein
LQEPIAEGVAFADAALHDGRNEINRTEQSDIGRDDTAILGYDLLYEPTSPY